MTIINEHKKLNFSSEREQSQACLNSAEHEKNQGRKVLNVPNLRFKGFQGEWEKTKFGDIAIVVGGGTPDTNTSQYWNGKIQWFTPSEIGRNKYVYNSVRTISEEGLNKSSAKLLPIGTILLSSRATVGECSINKKECTTNQGFQSLIPKENISNEFVYYLIQTKRKDLIRKSCGSTFLEISANEVRKIVVSIPTIKEQDKIAKLLSLLDERIATQNKIIEDLKKLKSAISENLFKAVKGDVVILYEICEIIKGKQINGEFLSEKGKYYVMNGGTEPSGYYSDYNVEANTISISEGGNSCGYVQFNSSPFWSGGHCYTIQKIADNVDNLYLYHYLKSHEDVIMKLRIGSGLPNIQKKDLAMFKIKLPTVEQQKSISTFLSSLERKAEIEEMLLNAMKKEKQYLLRQMFI